jgi:hypothetical protein
MKHIVFYSGGIGSWMTARRVVEKHGKENVVLLFTDTLFEDADLYRFIDETVKQLGCEYVSIADGRNPLEVFRDTRFLGNSRLAKCSHVLKQDTAKKWINEHYTPETAILYLGIDWSEDHRTTAPRRNWAPFQVEFPMCEEPYLSKEDMISELKKCGIEIPELYKRGFSHNNCATLCVRGGQGHWMKVLKEFPDRFAMMENFEREMQDYLGKPVTILKRTRGGVTSNLSLEQLRIEVESDRTEQLDIFDIGGCGCFVMDDEEDKDGRTSEQAEGLTV